MATYTTTAQADPHTITVTDDPDLVTITIEQADVTLSLNPVEYTAQVTSVNGNIGAVTLDTDDVSEATNLYYTDARVQTVIDNNTAGYITDYTVTESDVTQHQAALSITESQISDLDKYTDADFDTRLATKSTSDVAEGTNLYYTNARFDTRLATKTTDDVAEGTNLYYTDARADARAQLKIDALVDGAPGALDTLNELAAAINDDADVYNTLNGLISTNATNIATKFNTADFNSTFDTRLATKDTDDVAEGSNLYYTQSRFNSAFGAKSTTDLSEGTNLYYTTARHNTDFDTKLAAADTGDLSEGTNLYYTDARANSAIDARVTGSFVEGLDFDSDGGTY